MTATVRRSPASLQQAVGLLAIVGVTAYIAIQAPTAGRALVGIGGFAVLVLVAMVNRRLALVLVVIFLVLLGFLRRALIPFTGWSPNDPLLLVSPLAAVVLWYFGREHGARRSFLSSAAAFLLLWSFAEVLNPAEGRLLTAAESLLFIATPLLWFFAGRSFEGRDHDTVLRVVFWMNLVVVALGLYHSFGHFLPFELTWVGVSGQGRAIFLPGFRIRPFSTLTSPQEYGFFLSFALMIIWARLLHRPKHPWLLAATMAITTVALFLQASRSIFLLFLAGLAITAIVRYRSPVTVLCVLLIATVLISYIFGLRGSVHEEADATYSSKSAIQTLIDHQLAGLSDPGSSTAPEHVQLVITGLRKGLRDPLGLGPSHGSIIGQKEAPTTSLNSESDIGNVSSEFGIVAGLTLVVFIGVALVLAARMEVLRPSIRHGAILGMGIAAFGQWATGALYCTSMLLWFLLGGLAREWAGADRPALTGR